MKKKYKEILRNFGSLVVSTGLLFSHSFGQTEVQIGSGTETSTNYPINSCYAYNYSQSIYHASEIFTSGGHVGNISKVRFHYVSGASASTNWNNWKVLLGNTSTNSFATVSSWISLANLTEVYSGTIAPLENNWFEITLTTPFLYTGENLVVAVDENVSGYNCTAAFLKYTVPATTGYLSLNFYSDSENTDPANPTAAYVSSSTDRPQIQLAIDCPPVTTYGPYSSCVGGTVTINPIPTQTIPFNWYSDAAATNLVGTGSSFTTPAISTNTDYFFRYNIPGCSNLNSVTIETSAVVVDLTPQNETCVGYANGTFSLASATCGTAPFTYSVNGGAFGAIPTNLTNGTYTVIAKDATDNTSSPITVVIGTTGTVMPQSPLAVAPQYNICEGTTSQPISVLSGGNPSGTYSVGNGSVMLNSGTIATTTISDCPALLSVPVPVGAVVTGVDVVYNITSVGSAYMGEQRSYLKCTSTGGMTEAGVISGVGLSGTMNYSRNGLGIANGIVSNGAIDFELHAFRTWSSSGVPVCGTEDAYINNNSFTVTVHYGSPGATVTWYDQATGGAVVGSGETIESIGTTVLNLATLGSYDFYAQSELNGCLSAARTNVTVNVTPVNVDIDIIDVSCNNGNDGSFVIDALLCGDAPLTYSVNGGAFGAIPTNLTVGPVTIQVKDANDLLSAIYSFNVQSAPAPSELVVSTFNNEEVTVGWTVNGSETSWNVEWGTPGFTPGTGTEIGSAVATTNPYVIGGLTGDTEYDIYVSANCGDGTTAISWDFIEAHTDCDPIVSFPWCESFEPTSSSIDCWTQVDVTDDIDNSSGFVYNAWTYASNDDMGGEVALSGENIAINFNQFNLGGDDYLITPRLTLTGNEVMSFNYYAINSLTEFKVMLSTTGKNPSDFTTELLAPMANDSEDMWQDTSIVLTQTGNVYIAFVRTAPTDFFLGIAIEDVCIDICVPVPGIDGAVTVCKTDGTVDLNGVITSEYTSGTWTYPVMASAVTGSTFNFEPLSSGDHVIEYVVSTACTSDTTLATVTVVEASSAGIDGTLTVCRNQLVNLYGGLNGNVDFGGTWYAPNGTALASANFTTGTLTGQFIYNYVVDNAFCDADTSEVLVNIQNCDYLGIDESTEFSSITIAPNPSTGIFQIHGVSGNNFTYEVLDVNGRVVKPITALNDTSTQVDLTQLQDGVYIVFVRSDDAQKMIRLVKQD